MNQVEYLLEFPWVTPLGWALVHFLWQGAVIGLVTGFLLRSTRSHSSNVRYVIGVLGIGLCALAPLVTLGIQIGPDLVQGKVVPTLRNADTQELNQEVSFPENDAVVSVQSNATELNNLSPSGSAKSKPTLQSVSREVETVVKVYWAPSLDKIVRWMVVVWFVGAMFMSCRLMNGWFQIQYWRRRSKPSEDSMLLDMVERLGAKLGVRSSITLLISENVVGPLTFGWLKAVILFPSSLLTGLSPEQIEAILAHEIAHIRRNDYLINLFQSVVEAVLFYHPAVWWISKQVRQLREECCDDIAASIHGDKVAYAKALTSLAEFELATSLALPATGGSLLQRLSRLLGGKKIEATSGKSNLAWLLTIFTIVTALSFVVCSPRLLASIYSDRLSLTKSAPQGQVIDELGKPVSGARVRLYYVRDDYEVNNRIVEETQSDSNGHFVLTSSLNFVVPSGSSDADHYYLFALTKGRAPAWVQILGGTPQVNNYTLTVTAPKSQTYSVVDMEGKPVEGATVWIRYAARQEAKKPFFRYSFFVPENLHLADAVTDVNGFATITNLPDTEYSIVASKEGYHDEMSCTTPSNGVPKFTIKKEGILEGTVLDPLGLPVENALVWVAPDKKNNYSLYFTGKTDAKGHFRIRKIWPRSINPKWGDYDVGIWHPQYVSKKMTVQFYEPKTVFNFKIEATLGTQVQGLLVDPESKKPVAGGRVGVDTDAGRQTFWTDSEGRFTCAVPKGKVYAFFNMTPPGGTYVVDERETRLSQSIPSHLDTVAFGKSIDILIGTPGSVRPLGTVECRVVNVKGDPIPLAQVSVIPQFEDGFSRQNGFVQGAWKGLFADEQGNFSYANVPVGVNVILVARTQDMKFAGITRTITATNLTRLGLPIVLQPTSEARFVLQDDKGQPRRKTKVIARPIIEGVVFPVSSLEQSLRTSDDGTLVIPYTISGLKYEVVLEGKDNRPFVFDPAQSIETKPIAMAGGDTYAIQLLGPDNAVIPIKEFKEWFVWSVRGKNKIRWENGSLPVQSRVADGVIVPRKPMVIGKPGEEVEFLIESERGLLVKAKGNIPDASSNQIVARSTEGETPSDTETDNTISDVGSKDVIGRVVDSEGRPISGALIDLLDAFWWKNKPNPVTDENGIFRIPEVGDQWISYLPIYKKGYGPVFLSDIPVGTGFRVKLQTTTRVKGKFDGENVGLVKLTFRKDKPTKRERSRFLVRDIGYQVDTHSDGSYEFPMEPGAYKFEAVAGDGRFAVGEVNVVKDQETSLPSQLSKGYPVTLQYVDCESGAPISGIEVQIIEQKKEGYYGPRENAQRTSNEEGKVFWNNLMPGKTRFDVTDLTFSLGQKNETIYARAWRETEPLDWARIDYAKKKPTRSEGVSTPIWVEMSPDLPIVRIQMEKGIRVSGTVKDVKGQTVSGVSIRAVPTAGGRDLTGDSRFTLRTNEKGEFSGKFPAGNGVAYNLCAYYLTEAEARYAKDYKALLANAVSQSFNSKPGDEFKFDLVMPKGAWLTGRVLTPDGKPAAGIEVQATAQDFMDTSYADRVTTTDSEGKFRIGPLRPAKYLIRPDTQVGVNIANIPGLKALGVTVADDKDQEIENLIMPTAQAQ